VIGHWGIAAAIALAPGRASYAATAFASDKSATAAQLARGFHGVAPEQQFFISWGQNTGAAMRLEAERQRKHRSASGSEVQGSRSAFQFTGVPAGIFLRSRSGHGETGRKALRGLVANEFP
jgi:hypothetical protein